VYTASGPSEEPMIRIPKLPFSLNIPGLKPSEPAAKPAPVATTAPYQPKAPGARPPAATGPMPTDPRQMDIVCPVLASLVNEGKVKMRPDGTMKLDDLVNAPALKLTGPMKTTLTGIGFLANKPGDIAHNTFFKEMNVLDLRAGLEKHPSDTAILTAGRFDQAKFDKLIANADGDMMTPDSFAKAIAQNVVRDATPGNVLAATVFGASASEVEFAALLTVFGKKDPATGKFGLTVEEVRGLFQDKKLPATGNPSLIDTGAMQASLKLKVDAQLAGVAIRSLATATGLSQAGMRLTEGDRASTAGAQASVSAGKAAACPHMNGSVKAPPQINDTVNAHTQAGVAER
jgi:hypothetical protein